MTSRNGSPIQPILFLLVLASTETEVSGSTNPGLKIRLSQPGLDYAAAEAVEQLSANVTGASLPDHSQKTKDVEYQLKDFKIVTFKAPKSSVILRSHLSLTWALTGAELKIHGLWSYATRGIIRLRDHGSVDASVSSAFMSLSVALGVSRTGRPTVKATECSCHLDRPKIRVSGGAAWLYNLIIGLIEQPISDQLQRVLCSAAKASISLAAAAELLTLPVTVPLGPHGNHWFLDYRMVSAPVLTSGYLESFHKGMFFNLDDVGDTPFQPAPLPSPPKADRMVTFWVSDYVLNTAGYVLHKRGVFRYRITKNILHGKEKDMLNASCCLIFCQCIGQLFPAVAHKFQNASIEVDVATTEPPSANIDSQNVTAKFVGLLTFRARLPDSSLADLFAIKAAVKALIVPELEDRILKARIGSISESLMLSSSAVGDVNVEALTFFFDAAKKKFIVPKLNDIGEHGMQLPVIAHVEFTNSSLRVDQHCVKVATDVKYRA